MQLIIVHRLLQSILLPPLNAVLVILFGYLFTLAYKKTGKAIIFIGFFFLYVQATPFFSYHISKLIELPPVTAKALKNSQAIVVLGGGINSSSYEYPTGAVAKTGTLIRLDYTAYLSKQYPDKLIVCSGGYTGSKYTEASVMRDTLIATFDVKNPIMIEDRSRDTDENAKFVARMLASRHIYHVIVVSQAYHVRRALMLFKKYGVDATGASTDYANSDDAHTKALMFIPNATAMAITSRTLHELFGYFFYSI